MRTFSHPGYKRFLLSVGCLLSIHFTALFFLTLFRLVFFFSANYDFPDQEHVGFMSIWPAFIRGVWFDNVIACYILLIPLVAVSISALFNYYGKYSGMLHVFFSVYSMESYCWLRQPIFPIFNISLKSSIRRSSIGLAI